MADAYTVIGNIAHRVCPHPLWDVYRGWIETNNLPEQSLRTASDFVTTHPVPILPGDAALSEPLLTRLLAEGIPDPDIAVFVIARILFGLVVLRTYLGLKPSHDAHIWRLWLGGELRRRYTTAERALQACTTIRVGASAKGVLDVIPHNGPSRPSFKITPSLEPCTDDDASLVEHLQIHWSESSNQWLSGQGIPPLAKATTTQVTPRPRPKRCTGKLQPASGAC